MNWLSDWIEKQVSEPIRSFFAGIALSLSLVSVALTYFVMPLDTLLAWVKIPIPKETLIARAFSTDADALTNCENDFERVSLQMSDYRKQHQLCLSENSEMNKNIGELRSSNAAQQRSIASQQTEVKRSQSALEKEQEKHSQTKQQLKSTQAHAASVQNELAELQKKTQIPVGFTVTEDGFVRNADGQKVCETITIEPPGTFSLGNGTSTSTYGKYQKKCWMSNGLWLPDGPITQFP